MKNDKKNFFIVFKLLPFAFFQVIALLNFVIRIFQKLSQLGA